MRSRDTSTEAAETLFQVANAQPLLRDEDLATRPLSPLQSQLRRSVVQQESHGLITLVPRPRQYPLCCTLYKRPFLNLASAAQPPTGVMSDDAPELCSDERASSKMVSGHVQISVHVLFYFLVATTSSNDDASNTHSVSVYIVMSHKCSNIDVNLAERCSTNAHSMRTNSDHNILHVSVNEYSRRYTSHFLDFHLQNLQFCVFFC